MKRCAECRRVYDRDAVVCPVDGISLQDFASDPLVGRTIAKRYRLLQRLGGGPLAAVYLAEESAAGRKVAVKMLAKELRCDDETLKQCRWDARFASASHPASIVRVYEVDRTDEGQIFIAMDTSRAKTWRTSFTARGGTAEFSTPFADCALRAGTMSFGHRSKACTPPAATDVRTVVGWSRPLLP